MHALTPPLLLPLCLGTCLLKAACAATTPPPGAAAPPGSPPPAGTRAGAGARAGGVSALRPPPPARGAWHASTGRAPSTLRLRLVQPAPFVCSWDGMTGGRPIEGLTLACASREVEVRPARGPRTAGQARRLSVLGCVVEGQRIARAVQQTTLDGVIPLAREPGLHLSREDDASMIVGGRGARLQLRRPQGEGTIGP